MITQDRMAAESGDHRSGDATSHPFDGITVRAARSAEDLKKVFEVRYRGYAKYVADSKQIQEDLDRSPGCVLLLATDALGRALGTMRLLDRRFGPIELERFRDINQLLPDHRHPVVEASRYSVPADPRAKWVKLALCRAYFQYCHANQVRTMLIWIRRSAEREYRRMLFEEIREGKFAHPLLGGQVHATWMLDVETAPERFRLQAQSLYRLLYAESHPHIRHD